jgi:hypothetical protein
MDVEIDSGDATFRREILFKVQDGKQHRVYHRCAHLQSRQEAVGRSRFELVAEHRRGRAYMPTKYKSSHTTLRK